MRPMESTPTPSPSIFGLLLGRKAIVAALTFFSIATTALTLVLPYLMGRAIDAFQAGDFDLTRVTIQFAIASFLIAISMYVAGIFERLSGEGVAKELRSKVMDKVSRQSFAYLTTVTPGKLLTNLTSDAQAVKMFASMAAANLITSVVMIVGAAILMFSLNWKLTLAVLAVVPLTGAAFAFIFSKVGPLFGKAQGIQDVLNRVITESITGAALVRVVNAQGAELYKFMQSNTEARDVGIRILALFALLFPVITFIANLAQLTILGLGGHFTITGAMSLGDFAAFTAYLALLIFPLMMLGFMSNVITQAQVSYGRINEVLTAPDPETPGTDTSEITGDIEVDHVSLTLGGKLVLKDVSLKVKAGTRTAVIGPTAAGKTQLLNVMTGLLMPEQGEVRYDGKPLATYDQEHLHSRVALVFQDSVMFNLSFYENIAFGGGATEEGIEKAIRTAELEDVVANLPQGLETEVSERGLNLSGGQKQRIMLARALALEPTVLLLDDFTARVDNETEKKILANLAREYPDVTLVSVTQKVAAATAFEQVVLLMEGEVLASGTHEELLKSSPEYAQIWESQKSTTDHE